MSLLKGYVVMSNQLTPAQVDSFRRITAMDLPKMTRSQLGRIMFAVLSVLVVSCANVPASSVDHSRHESAPTAEGYVQTTTNYHGELVVPPRFVQDFTLPSTFGSEGAFTDLDGYWRMIFFGYMHCPDFCPMTLVDFRQTQELLSETAGRVRFVYITIDGTRDEPGDLARYLSNFSDKFVGFVGDPETLAKIQPDYGFYYSLRLDEDPQALLQVEHSAQTYLVDPYGRLQAKFAYHTDPQVLADAIRWHIEQDALDTCE